MADVEKVVDTSATAAVEDATEQTNASASASVSKGGKAKSGGKAKGKGGAKKKGRWIFVTRGLLPCVE
jgi:hypothetical protein